MVFCKRLVQVLLELVSVEDPKILLGTESFSDMLEVTCFLMVQIVHICRRLNALESAPNLTFESKRNVE
jgi:hypothetical protein